MGNVRTATNRAIRSNWESVNGPRDVLISEREVGLFAAHDVSIGKKAERATRYRRSGIAARGKLV